MMGLQPFDDDRVTQLVLGELDKNIRDLFTQLCLRKCGIPLLRFLDAHANSLHTIEGIAFYLGENDADVECGLDDLIELGFARELHAAGFSFFGVTSDPARRQLIRELGAWQDRWRVRMARIGQVLDGKITTPVTSSLSSI